MIRTARPTLLSPDEVRQLGALELTYDAVGASLDGPPPAGFATFTRTRRLPTSIGLDAAARALLGWQVQLRAGLRVATSDPELRTGTVCRMRAGIGPLAVPIPCRVVRVITEVDRVGFAYGTLPGHPESGEESFVLRRKADGTLEFTVSAFSRPATRLARLGGPVTTGVQRLMTSRYLRSLDS